MTCASVDDEGGTTEALVVFGGNGNGGDADSDLHLYESKSNEWTVRACMRVCVCACGAAPSHPDRTARAPDLTL